MVVFTCNHCGESARKNAVEKHYTYKCRGAPKSVSCMDCMKDFYGEDYVAHIKCITEAEKYSGKGYVPKETKNSGQKKQEGWMEIIRSILNTKEYNLSPTTRGAFQRLESVDNVPRKKAKFINFAANCIKMRRDQVEEVWSVLEKELEKMKAAKAEAASRKQEESSKPVIPDIIIEQASIETEPAEGKELSIGDEVVTMRIKKSKSKKHRVDKEIQNTIEQDEEMEKKKQKKKRKADKKDQADEPSKKKKSSETNLVAKQEEANAEQEPIISTTTPDEFQWTTVMVSTVQKYGNTMKMDKLKKKVEKMYLARREWTAFTEKQQTKFSKKFEKYVKKCNLKVEGNMVKVE